MRNGAGECDFFFGRPHYGMVTSLDPRRSPSKGDAAWEASL